MKEEKLLREDLNLKYLFKEAELTLLGFFVVTDGDYTYLEYVFDKLDYFNSKFLATNSIKSIDWVLYSNQKWAVVNPNNNEGEEYLTFEQLEEIIKNGEF
mgnify:CR=1 FL=1